MSHVINYFFKENCKIEKTLNIYKNTREEELKKVRRWSFLKWIAWKKNVYSKMNLNKYTFINEQNILSFYIENLYAENVTKNLKI